MGANTKIAWTDHTMNPWLGCTRVSEGCRHCYAEALVEGRMGLDRWGAAPRVRTKQPWKDVLKWNRLAAAAGVRRRVFCASLADVFEDAPGLAAIRADLWPLIDECSTLDWQLLTKRPENIQRMVPGAWIKAPRAHVWFGTSVENQETADRRIPHLLAVPATVRFLSCEPLLAPIDLAAERGTVGDFAPGRAERVLAVAEGDPRPLWACARCDGTRYEQVDPYVVWCPACRGTGVGIHWVIVGAESGPGRRTMDLAWARAMREQCRDFGVPFFFKQGSGHKPGMHEDALGEVVQEFPGGAA